jgi:hypothetical protein
LHIKSQKSRIAIFSNFLKKTPVAFDQEIGIFLTNFNLKEEFCDNLAQSFLWEVILRRFQPPVSKFQIPPNRSQ